MPTPPKPTALTSVALFIVLVTLMVYLRLELYRHEYSTLSYSVPLLLCLWYRDLRLLWAMAAAFECLTSYKAWVVLPDFHPTNIHDLGQWVMQVANIAISASVVHLIIELMHSLKIRQGELEHTNAMLRDTEATLRSQNDRLNLLSDALVVLLRGRDPQRTLREFFPRVTQLLGVDTFLNYMVDKAGSKLELQGCAGVPEEVANQIQHLQLGEALCGSVAQTRQPILVSHIQDSTEPEFALLRSLEIQAFYCHPLESGAELTGTIAFASRTKPEFTTEDVEFVRLIARYVALGIDRAQTQQDLKQRVSSRTEELRQTITSLESAVTERQRAEEQLRERHEELKRRTAQLRALAMDLTLAEEQERRRLAQALHDNLQPLILAARMQLKIFTQHKEQDEQLEPLRFADAILRDAAEQSRSLTVQLTPPVLHEFGLAEALIWLAESSQQYLLRVKAEMDAQSPPGHPTSILLFQFARELLLNVAKHAGVPTATLILRQNACGMLELEVSDEGAGFNTDSLDVEAGTGFGLFSIRERLNHLGGSMTIDSGPGRGTRILLQAPLPAAQDEIDSESLSLMPEDCIVTDKRPRTVGEAGSNASRSRLLLVDDHVLVRSGLAEVLRRELPVEIVGEVSTGLDAIRLARELQPDLILMDVNLPGMSGIEATRAITRELASVCVVGLSMHDDESVANAMLNAGAVGFLHKSNEVDEVMLALRAFLPPNPDSVSDS